MPSTRKDDQKAALDVAAWMFNIVTSVGVIIVNKALLAAYGFTFGTLFLPIQFMFHLLVQVVSSFLILLYLMSTGIQNESCLLVCVWLKVAVLITTDDLKISVISTA